jgi:DNA-binding response OmpR family regulator
MDLQMPVKDGYQTTEYIRCELKSDIPIIAMTAHSLVGEKQKCFDIGMNGYVPKPFKQAELLNEIERVMKKWPESNFKGIDLSYLLEMSCNDQNFINDMIALFVSKVPVEVETLEKAITTHDYDSVKKIAHNMKSSLPIFKLDKLLKYLLAIEKEAANNRFNDETIKKFSAFKNELTEVVNKLNTY